MKIAKKFLKWITQPLADFLRPYVLTALIPDEAVAQKNLMNTYRLLARTSPDALPSFDEVGFRKYSQHEEDGILLYIFSLVKPINKKVVEICAGRGTECNATNLIVNHGWWGHLFDGSARNVRSGRKFFSKYKDTFAYPPVFRQAWMTAENVNQEIELSGVSGPVDLLSLDIDGMDYWVWKAIESIDPQVVVCEIHNPIPADRALTVPYDPEFVYESPLYRSASLAAMAKLGKEKGYRLVGTHRHGFNAFFIKKGVGENFFPEINYKECLQDPHSEKERRHWDDIKDMGWQEV